MFRMELRRALWNPLLLLAWSLGLLALMFGMYGPLGYLSGPAHPTPQYLASLPPFYNNAYDAVIWAQHSVIGLIVPLLAVLPFADSLALDRTSGYLRYVLVRASYKRYGAAKVVACLVSGGVAVALPLLLLFAYTNLTLPRGLNIIGGQQRVLSGPEALGPFGSLYHLIPDLYIVSLIALSFIFGASYACLGLAISTFTDNRYIALASPFLAYHAANFIAAISGYPNWSPFSTFVPHWKIGVTWVHVAGGLGCVLSISLFLLVFRIPRMRASA